ncbi:hypothetical protein PDQ34_26980 [Bacillus cereus]|nr:hypothetical protein [Bacillus cereus]MDA2572758.1 hypothetical protein [Bacillus cereus]
MQKQITLSNGKIVNINPNLNAYVLFQLEKEGVITKTFMSSLLSTGDARNLDLLDAIRTVYAAYRQATPKEYMPFVEFSKVYAVDMAEAMQVFGAIMKKEQNSNMASGFNKNARKKKR